jgi:hypothetical protein
MLIKKTQEEMDRENEAAEEEDAEEYVSADEVEANQQEQEVPMIEQKKAAFFEKFSNVFKKKEKKEKEEVANDQGNDALSLLERNEQEKEDERIKKDAIDKFIDIAMNKGVDQALSAVKKTKSAYYVDEFHDRLIEELKKVKDNKSGK